ncbi:cell division protein ZapA [Rhodoferax sp. BAB1]|uniref:cell division protein ZapA n=1 Tax=Rhodoferax sp. BAB1 TaxID=2741720 RepID=UPI0015756B02|nr:cell division protein ZapA [Rhodoferax sp. BAB1]QKO21663.1 cell division protein ZapA [Rhodoferax sp. BAB1]
MSTKQLEVQIMGQSYLLGCPEGGEASLLEAVERVDTAMCKIRDAGKVKARDRIAVLAALNLAFDLSDRGTPAVAAAPRAASAIVPRADDNAVLGTLIERLDVALGQDGQLI